MEIRKFVPPVVKDFYKKHISRYGWFGNYSSWEDAHKKSSGYDADNILRKVRDSLLKVKNGKAVYERDSVLFNKKEYSAAVLAALLLAKKNDSLSIIDFGGSLGTTYFQNKEVLDEIKNVDWCILEQKNFTDCGKKHFQDKRLKFYDNFDECLKKENPNLIILSSVLPYVEKPYELIDNILNMGFEYILIDRTPFVKGNDRLTIQRVNPRIYPASYPCWFLSEAKLLKLFDKKYTLISKFSALDESNSRFRHKGMLFVKK